MIRDLTNGGDQTREGGKAPERAVTAGRW